MTYKEHITSVNPISLNSEYHIYPNPATERVFIDFHNIINHNILVRINDLYGRVVYQGQKKADTGQSVQIDVTDFEPGIYFFRIENGSKIYKGKFIVN